MAVVRVEKATIGHNAAVEDRIRRKYEDRWIVTVNSLTDTVIDVREDLRLPRAGATHPDDAQAICRTMDISRSSKWTYDAVAQFDTFVSDPAQIDLEENPLFDPLIVEFSTIHETQVLQKARNINNADVALCNSAFEPWDAADLVIPKSRTAWRITFNRASFDNIEAEDYTDSVNSTPFYGFEVRQALMHDISAIYQIRNNIRFWQITCEIHFDRDTYDLQLLDQGHRELVAGVVPFKLFADVDGKPDPIPRLLNGSGHQLANGAAPVFIRYRYKKERDFFAFTP